MGVGVLAFVVLLSLVMTNNSADAIWCICRSDVGDTFLQNSLDYACGNGADCKPIIQGGVCYQPTTVRAHCSYAVNSYFQNKGQAQGTCIFSNTTIVTQSDPSTGGTCLYPSGPSFTRNGTVPGLTPPSSAIFPPPGSPGGGFLGPTGNGINNSSSTVRVFGLFLHLLLLSLLVFTSL